MIGQGSQVHREVLSDGRIKLAADDCVFLFRRLKPGALLVTISGHDTGQFGTSTLDEIRMELLRYRSVELFVDARDALRAAVSVSDEWTRFFSLNREHLKRVSVLVGSKGLYLTIAIAQHLSRTSDLMQIYSDFEVFDKLVIEAQNSTAR